MLLPQDTADGTAYLPRAVPPYMEEQILASWVVNAATWTRAVRRGEILSRVRVTNGAILQAITDCAPATLLDLGCGEGWLSHHCARQGIVVLGIDAVADLTAIAAEGAPAGASFRTLSYQQIAAGALQQRFDMVVANFSLLGDHSLDELFTTFSGLLSPGGSVLVQTLHPLLACADHPYEDGWREGSWAGFSPAFRTPAPWFFRTLESWVRLFQSHGLIVRELREPIDPLSGQPASVILRATV
ncbi:class I SAM-dependent methyltransferase [Cyanobium sp. Candia 9D4]|uniref:class I SAM-dependent methyltransferase n=1 Tax=Cyanobium sp. Candia 9D4 TaxID=2823707 RepID=UPI0020CD4BD4|nr:class I SAM-dependent methyltransferase [Cyanobium sp. Candia 9D4]MCP9934470.1 class I SAM-dependent methyltransferase [Cyanobium sp. Candia 9D4]